MNTEKRDLDYFRLRLQELLNTSFPELAGDTELVVERAKEAAFAYEEAFRSGNTAEMCNEIADFILFEGFHFSRFDTVFQVVCHEFDTLMADEELRPFALKMLAVCEPVFMNYALSDDFAYLTDYDLLYTELTGTIQIWIEEHGLQ
jgi:hypothetical protein